MKHTVYLFILICCFFTSCVKNKVRKTELFYFENQKEINSLLKNYNELYKKQAFAIGFSDKSFKHVSLQMYTDSVRFIYSTKFKRNEIFEEMKQSTFSQEEIVSLTKQLKELKCLWIDKSDVYIHNKKTVSTNLSFGSLMFNQPFEENKFYVLAFLETSLPKKSATTRLKNFGYHEIDKNIYFTITTRFR